jgi:hypothetical protein
VAGGGDVPVTAPAGARALPPSPPELLPLGCARIVLGVLFLLRTTPLFAPLHPPFLAEVTPLLGWPDERPHLSPSIPALSGGVVAALCVARTLAALAFTVGVWTRAAGVLAGLFGYLTVLQDPARSYATFYVLFLGSALLALAGAGGACAVRPERPVSPRSGIWLMRVWIASIYVWAALAKLRPDWLDGRALALFLDEGAFRPGLGAILLGTPARRAAAAQIVVALELALPALLLWPRTRRVGLVLALAFHAVLEVVAAPDLFGWEMAALLLCFWEPPPRGP